MGFWDLFGLGGETNPQINATSYDASLGISNDDIKRQYQSAFDSPHRAGYSDFLSAQANAAQGRNAMGSSANVDESRRNMMAAASNLQNNTGYAQAAAKQASLAAAQNAMAQYAAARRGMNNQGLAMKMMQDATSNAGLQYANQGMLGGLQERQQNQQLAAGMYSNLYGQDMARQQMMLQQQALNDELVKYYTTLGYTAEEANRAANMARQQMRFQDYAGMRDAQAGLAGQRMAGRADITGRFIGGAMQAAGGVAAGMV